MAIMSEDKPYSEWETDDLQSKYNTSKQGYMYAALAKPDTHPHMFAYAEEKLAEAQDIRDELHARGVSVGGYLLPGRWEN